MHRGVDFVAKYKSNVYATAPGKVIAVGRQGKYGRTIDIRHEFGLVTRYASASLQSKGWSKSCFGASYWTSWQFR